MSGARLFAYRDRAIIIDFYLYSGARLATGCRLEVKDFRWDEADPRIRISEKRQKRRTIGLNSQATRALGGAQQLRAQV